MALINCLSNIESKSGVIIYLLLHISLHEKNRKCAFLRDRDVTINEHQQPIGSFYVENSCEEKDAWTSEPTFFVITDNPTK